MWSFLSPFYTYFKLRKNTEDVFRSAVSDVLNINQLKASFFSTKTAVCRTHSVIFSIVDRKLPILMKTTNIKL